MRVHFVSFPETGHYLALFGLAREMANRGAAVHFLGTLDFQRLVEEQGFAFRAVFTDLFPHGHAGGRTHVATARFAEWMSGMRGEFRTLQALCRRVLDGSALAAIADGTPDLILVDSMIGFLALPAAEAGLACGLVGVTLPRECDPDVPPLECALTPTGDEASRHRVRRQWRRTLLANRMRAAAFSPLGLSPAALIARTSRRLEAQSRGRSVAVRYDVEFGSPLPLLPEFILSSEDFDFPRRARPGRYYVGPCVDVERRAIGNPVPQEWLTGSDRIVYCSLGTQNREYAETNMLFEAVIAACAPMRGYRVIVSSGGRAVPVPPDYANRVLEAPWLPQLAVLEHAAVVITNGSFNTVKECGWFGVPMLFRASARDHPGCAARAIRHGMGVAIADLSVGTLRGLIAQVHSAPVQAAVGDARRRFRAAQDRLAPLRFSIGRICKEHTMTSVFSPSRA